MSTNRAQLFYIVGPSGSGKDSILQYFRQHFAGSCKQPVTIAHRYITRQSDHHENSICLSSAEFQMRLDNKFFAMHWQANGHRYGIGIEVNTWLDAGVNVLMNGSRAHLSIAEGLYPKKLHSIGITVPDEVLEQRLKERQRESDHEIQERLQRHKRIQPKCMTNSTIDNSASIKEAAKKLKQIMDG